jgi:hypothetical protein
MHASETDLHKACLRHLLGITRLHTCILVVLSNVFLQLPSIHQLLQNLLQFLHCRRMHCKATQAAHFPALEFAQETPCGSWHPHLQLHQYHRLLLLPRQPHCQHQ